MFFQTTILRKHLAMLDEEQVRAAWGRYKAYFLDPAVQANIRQSKEEQFQEGFLRELFVRVLGYTLNPTPGYNLITEQKNETDSKKADGAILRDGKVIGVIELKDHKTTDLKQVEQQAFGYKHRHPDARYVIISNFEKLRLYIDNAVEFVEWNLFTLSYEDFRLLYFCMSWETLPADLPLKAKQESVSSEDQITARLYKDYSAFKRELFEDIVRNNPTPNAETTDGGNSAYYAETTDNVDVQENHDNGSASVHGKLLLFKKTQKLLDRLLFIFFAEDCGLLPPNSMVRILDQWEQLRELDEYVPLYNRIRKYFGYLDTGYKGKRYEIFAYNGGLFKPDEVLDGLKISDDVLARHTRRLSEYDYASEVDVNILGHIFENSLNEIEEFYRDADGSPGARSSSPAQSINADGDRQAFHAPSKRKRDGVFYTPQYITKYIVENTVGRLCTEKKAELGISSEGFLSLTQNSLREAKDLPAQNNLREGKDSLTTKRRHLDAIKQYREWLLGIKICDPACGSGAFLNAALQFLMAEHRLIDEMEAEITGSAIVFQNVENSILENNLYGVDINEESVEIAKLALWLRTAKPHRKLSSLNNNIKCGNSLISDPAVAGEKAFDWKKEFPQVFAKGGFDVVIGNPPYVRADSPGNALDFRNYMTSLPQWETLGGKWDLYIPFIERAIKLCKNNGLVSLIIPDAYCHAEYSKKSLDYVKSRKLLYRIDYYPDMQVFENVGVKSVIVNYALRADNGFEQRIHTNTESYDTIVLPDYPESLRLDAKKSMMSKLSEYHLLSHICYITKGIVGNSDEKHYKGEFEVGDLLSNIKDETHPKLYFEGKDIAKWRLVRERYIEYGTERSPSKWSRKGFTELFEGSQKLVTMRSPGLVPRTLLDTDSGYFNESAIGFKRWIDLRGVENNSLTKAYTDSNERASFETVSQNYSYLALLAVMNSSLVRYELNTNRRSNIHIYPEDWKVLRIPVITDDQQDKLATLANRMLALNKELQEKRARFLRRLQENVRSASVPTRGTNISTASGDTCVPGDTCAPVRITAALETFDTLDFAGFVAELKKQKISLTLKQQDEWEEYFNLYKAACNDLSAQIAAIDREIDRLVYDLYGLTEEEKGIIEA